jgi:probable F420-dependent oxidoreductase
LKYGAYLYPPAGSGDPDDVVRLAEAAERLGFDSVWLGDHVAWPSRFDPSPHHREVGGRTPGPAVVNMNVFEPLTTLAFIAASVHRVRLGLGVLIAPYRHPVLAAKMLAMLDVLSGGRLIVGVGTGWLREEFEMLGSAPYKHRGGVTDEYLQSFVELWTQPEPQFEGSYVSLSGVLLNPKPVQKPHPPIWIGGNGSVALKRAAAYGNGWMPLHQTPAEMLAKVPELHVAVRAAGRQPEDVGVAIGCRFRFGDGQDGEDSLTGTATQIADQLRLYQRAGVHEVHLLNDGYKTVADLVGAWERFNAEVLSKV